MTSKVAVITGAAGGLGAASVGALAARGWRVFAADLDPDAVELREGVVPCRVDVTDVASVARLCDDVQDAVDGVDAVVSFAGILAVGSLVEIEEAEFARVLEVNVMGTFRVNRGLFPLVRARRGRFVTISSETGWQTAMPFNGPYAMSKHAIEAYSDALRREMALLGLHVVKIQPGPFRTAMVSGMQSRFTAAADHSTHFGGLLRRMLPFLVREQARAHDPSVLARVVVRACEARHPRVAYSVRPEPTRRVLSWLPDGVVDRILKAALPRSAR
ncbi:MAG: SDR family NAD(P)-dependent oxidoreductase [Myxococcota bacterium]